MSLRFVISLNVYISISLTVFINKINDKTDEIYNNKTEKYSNKSSNNYVF